MKKYFTFGLIMSLVSGACFAEHPMITQLLQEKQAKMEKLQKCKGTTKNLKIAGISTLGITAVGVGANIAEAVVLSNTKDDVKKAKDARDKEQKIKEGREKNQEFMRFCRVDFGGTLTDADQVCTKTVVDTDSYNASVSIMRSKFDKCETTVGNTHERCVDEDNHVIAVYLRPESAEDKKGAKQPAKPAANKKTPKGDAGDPAPAGEKSDSQQKVIPGQEQSCNIGWRWNSISKQCEELGENGEENFGQCEDGAFFDGQGCVTLNQEPEEPKKNEITKKPESPQKTVSCGLGYKYSDATGNCEKVDQDFANVEDIEKAEYVDVVEPQENKNPSPTGLSSQYFGEAQAICKGAYGIKGELLADGSGYHHCSGITEADCATLNTKDPYIRFVYTDVPGHGTKCWVFHE